MLKIISILCMGLVVVNAILSDEEEWQKFKSLNHKLYESQDEENLRYEIFKDNLKQIREHNEKFEKGETTFQMGVNKFSDLTFEEFKEIYGKGVLPRKSEEGDKPVYA